MQTTQNFMTINDVKDHLNISKSAAYELAHSKDFPVCRVGGSIRVPREAFLAWVNMRTSISPQLHNFMTVSASAYM